MGKLQRRSSSTDGAARRAWRLLRLALIWARKGGLLKCRLVAELRHGAKYLKGLNDKHAKDMIRYGERELSFDDTPIIHLKMNRPHSLRFIIPCIKPHVTDFDYEFSDDDCDDDGFVARRSFLGYGTEDCEVKCDEDEDEDEGIDVRADEFIAKFYEQIKLQREVSFQRSHNNATIQLS